MIHDLDSLIKQHLHPDQQVLIRGYNDAELAQIAYLYDIKIQGQLYTYLKKMGRCDSGLFYSTNAFHHFEYCLENFLKTQFIFRLDEEDEGLQENWKVFQFDWDGDGGVAHYLKTADDNPDMVYSNFQYQGSNNSYGVYSTPYDFFGYLFLSVGKPNPIYQSNMLKFGLTHKVGNLLPERFALPTLIQAKGYNTIELKKIASVFEIDLNNQLGYLLATVGRCDAGILNTNRLNFYTISGLREQYVYQKEFDSTLHGDFYKLKGKFKLNENKEQGISLFVATKTETPNQVFIYDKNNHSVSNSGFTLSEYINSIMTYPSTRSFNESDILLIKSVSP